MSNKHTPGPWAHINPDGFTVRHPQVYSDTGPICNATWLGDGRIDELRANARLIAAAPDLLGALHMWMEIHDKPAFAGKYGKALDVAIHAQQVKVDAAAAAARAAIAKATGGAV